LKKDVLALLDAHYDAFYATVDIARKTKHPVPMDTRGWSQILVSALCSIDGIGRKKGADLVDGSDVKGANTWEAIDTPRFNGVIKAGTQAETANSVKSLASMPYLFFVLWDRSIPRKSARCRIWCVRPSRDHKFSEMCARWYEARAEGIITSNNFQLHPPRGNDTNVIRNTYGNLTYPLLLCAERPDGSNYRLISHDATVLTLGLCT
jgi:hypothetical protein